MRTKTRVSIAGILITIWAGVTFAQAPLTALPLPKNRESTPSPKYSAFDLAFARTTDIAASRQRIAAGRAGSVDSEGVARFWTMTPTEKRVGRFMRAMPRLRQIFVSEGVPGKLIWLAEIESAFDPHAVSHAGAVGLFQLMPDTAERFGLRIYPLDERKLPEKSARAAAQYLKQLHGRFGCWNLALAAYNAGENRVGRTMQQYALSTFDEIAPYLPQETRMYVPRVIAIAQVREGG